MNFWKGKDPWTYRDAETTDDMIRIRLSTLDGQIRNSTRYQLQRGKILDDIIDDIETNFDGGWSKYCAKFGLLLNFGSYFLIFVSCLVSHLHF